MYLLIVNSFDDDVLYYFKNKQDAINDKNDWDDRGFETTLYRIIEVKENK